MKEKEWFNTLNSSVNNNRVEKLWINLHKVTQVFASFSICSTSRIETTAISWWKEMGPFFILIWPLSSALGLEAWSLSLLHSKWPNRWLKCSEVFNRIPLRSTRPWWFSILQSFWSVKMSWYGNWRFLKQGTRRYYASRISSLNISQKNYQKSYRR